MYVCEIEGEREGKREKERERERERERDPIKLSRLFLTADMILGLLWVDRQATHSHSLE